MRQFDVTSRAMHSIRFHNEWPASRMRHSIVFDPRSRQLSRPRLLDAVGKNEFNGFVLIDNGRRIIPTNITGIRNPHHNRTISGEWCDRWQNIFWKYVGIVTWQILDQAET